MEREHSIESVLDSIAAEKKLKKREAPPQEVVYDKALEAWNSFSEAAQYFNGKNTEIIRALKTVLEATFIEDYQDVIPLDPEYDDYQISEEARAKEHRNYLKALATIEQYIKENKPMH